MNFKLLKLIPILPIIGILPVNAGEVQVSPQSPYAYEEYSVLQLKVRGEYGRYLTFIGRSSNSYESWSYSGNPGSINCTTSHGAYGMSSTNCNRVGYVPPSHVPGGVENRNFVYELDCQDMTFDRKGDRSNSMFANLFMLLSL